MSKKDTGIVWQKQTASTKGLFNKWSLERGYMYTCHPTHTSSKGAVRPHGRLETVRANAPRRRLRPGTVVHPWILATLRKKRQAGQRGLHIKFQTSKDCVVRLCLKKKKHPKSYGTHKIFLRAISQVILTDKWDCIILKPAQHRKPSVEEQSVNKKTKV